MFILCDDHTAIPSSSLGKVVFPLLPMLVRLVIVVSPSCGGELRDVIGLWGEAAARVAVDLDFFGRFLISMASSRMNSRKK